MTQPALSKWLRELERSLDAVLFERTTRRVAPTLYGEALLSCVDRVLTDIGAVSTTLEALRQGLGAPVTIGVLPGLAPVMIPDAMESLRQANQSLQIRLREDTLDRLLPQIQRRELDLVICRLEAPALKAGLVAEPLYRDEVRVVAGQAHPLLRHPEATWREAAAYPWIVAPLGSPMRTAVEAEFAYAGVGMPTIALESLSWPTNCAIAQRSTCLFAASSHSASASPGGECLRFLPLRFSHVAPVVGLLRAPVISAPVDALRTALKEVVRKFDTA